MAKSLPKRQETGGLKDKKKNNREQSIRGFYISLKWEVSWRKKTFWNLARENMLQDGGALPEEECDVIGAYTAML